MLKKTKLLHLNLAMFDDGAGTGTMAQTEGGQPSTEQSETGEAVVVYGKQEEPVAEVKAEKTPEEKRKAYDEYIRGEGKEFYTEDTQKMINRRFRETKALQEQIDSYRTAVEPLMEKYGVDSIEELSQAIKNDNDVWQQRADDDGLTIEQAREKFSILAENKKLKALNEARERKDYVDKQYEGWMNEATEVRETYPEFDIRAELQNPKFRSMLTQGLPMMDAYEVTHLAEIKARTAKESERAITENIKTRGNRPIESGASNPAGVIVKSDPDRFTDEDIAEVIRRVRAGEKISF